MTMGTVRNVGRRSLPSRWIPSDIPAMRSTRVVLLMLVLAAALAACGGSPAATPAASAGAIVTLPPGSTPRTSTVPASVATRTPRPTAGVTAAPSGSTAAAGAAGQCPLAATVGGALGVKLPKPTLVPGGGGASLPAGATGIACDYHASSANVIIELISNIDPSSIGLFSSRFPVAYKSVSGLGDQARSFSQPLNGGKDNEGVVATKGSSLVSIVATATPATLKQVEALVGKLL